MNQIIAFETYAGNGEVHRLEMNLAEHTYTRIVTNVCDEDSVCLGCDIDLNTLERRLFAMGFVAK